MVGTLIFYLAVLFVCMGLSYWSLKNKTKIGVVIAYLILVILSIFRFNIGNDYEGYVSFIHLNASIFRTGNSVSLFSIDSIEPLMYVLIYIFKNVGHPHVWIIGIYSIIGIFFLYKAFDDNDCHISGILILFLSGMLFASWDQIRQGAAISVIIYAIKYIKDNNIYKFLLFFVFAFIAHYSVLFLFPFYFVSKIKPSKYIYVFIILFLAISSAATDYFDLFYSNIISYLPYFDTNVTSASLVQIVSSGFKVRIIYYSLVWCVVIIYLPDNEKVLTNFLFIGAVIFIMASGALNIMRVSFYFIFTTVLSIPIVLKIPKARFAIIIMLIGLFMFFVRDVVTDTNTRGCVPYKSIFSSEFSNQFN